jgi:hypothetical protein
VTVGAWPISIKSMSRARGHTVDMHDNVRSATRARGRTFDEPDNNAPGNDRETATSTERPAMRAALWATRARGHTVDMPDNVLSATRARGRTFDEPDNNAPGNDRGKATKSARPAMYAVFATTRAREEVFDEPDGSGFRARGKTVDSRPRQMFQQLVGTGDDEVPGACSTNVRPVHAHLCCMPIRLLVVLLA